GQRAFFRTPMTVRMTAGSLMGIAGITLVFSPEFASLGMGEDVMLGAVYTVLAVLVSTIGSLMAHGNREARWPLWSTMAWGMLYGAISALAFPLGAGEPLTFEPSARYVCSLLY